jgi:hypothetical protein
MDHAAVDSLLELQSGVISRAQLLGCGAAPHDVKRLIRRRDLNELLPGVYMDHTGAPTWLQRAWAGALARWPAALSGASAIRSVVGPGWRGHDDLGPIELAVARHRTLIARDGYRLRHLTQFEARVQWSTSPPRVRLEDAILQVAADQTSEWQAIGVLTDACGSRRTTPARLLAATDALTRLRRRRFLREVLVDLDSGACSVLEQGYLRLVERPHLLPAAERQVTIRNDRGREYRDVEYRAYLVGLELDGRVYHESASQRDRDLDRDLDAAVAGKAAVRLGWGQVFGRPCLTAERVAALLSANGWIGCASSCGPDCVVSRAARTCV